MQVNIAIVRTFVKLRQLLSSHADLARKLHQLEAKYDGQFAQVFRAINALMAEPPEPSPYSPGKKKIGFDLKR